MALHGHVHLFGNVGPFFGCAFIHTLMHSFILFFGCRMSFDYSRAPPVTCAVEGRLLMTLSLWSSSVPRISIWLVYVYIAM